MPPIISALNHRHDMSSPPENHNMLHTGRFFHRVIDDSLQFQDLSPTITTISCHNDLCFAVLDTFCERFRAEPREDYSEGQSESRASEHCDRELRDQGHVDGHRVALPEAEVLKNTGESVHLTMELSIGDRPMLSVFTLPQIRGFVLAPGFHMAVHSVLGRVQRSSNKPLGKRRIPLPNPFPPLSSHPRTPKLWPKPFSSP